MNTEVIISIIATLTLIGLALASVVFDADSAAQSRLIPEQAAHPPAAGEWPPNGSPALVWVRPVRAGSVSENGHYAKERR